MADSLARDRVPLGVKWAFGFAEFGLSLSANFLIFYLLIFLNTVAGLPGTLAGAVLLVGKIVDAVTDPLVGSISDGWNSRWGRRLPFMAIGAPLLALAFLGQMWVPDLSTWMKFAFYVLIGVASQTLYSMVTIPYTSLTAELTHDYEERTSLNSFRQIFSMSGSMAALIVAGLVFKFLEKEGDETQYLVMGFVGAGIIAISLGVSVFFIRHFVVEREKLRLANEEATMLELMRRSSTDKPVEVVPPKLSYLEQIKIAFSNRPFVILCLLYLFAWLAVQLTAAELTYYLIFWMGLTKAFSTVVILMVMGTALALLAPWSLISHRLGKKGTFLAGGSIWLVAQCILLTLHPGQNILLYITAVLAGFGISVCYLVPWAMLPDVIELDELETGKRREGIFYGFIVFLQKLAVAGALFLAGFVLDRAGFQESLPYSAVERSGYLAVSRALPPGGFQRFDWEVPISRQAAGLPAEEIAVKQPDSALFSLRMMVGATPMVLLAFAMLAAFFFPITKEGHEATLAELKRRRGEHPPDDHIPPEYDELLPQSSPPAHTALAELLPAPRAEEPPLEPEPAPVTLAELQAPAPPEPEVIAPPEAGPEPVTEPEAEKPA